MERHKFNTRVQPRELGDLKDQMNKHRLVCAIENDRLRRSLLREDKLTLQKAIELCQISELPEQRMKELTSTHEVNEVKYPRQRDPRNRQRQQQQTEEKQQQPWHQQRQASGYRNESGKSRQSAGKKGEGYRQKSCTYCGNVRRQRNCPAYGKECRACGKLNHFERVCRSTATQATKQNQQINTVIEDKQGIQPFLIEKLDTYNITRKVKVLSLPETMKQKSTF